VACPSLRREKNGLRVGQWPPAHVQHADPTGLHLDGGPTSSNMHRKRSVPATYFPRQARQTAVVRGWLDMALCLICSRGNPSVVPNPVILAQSPLSLSLFCFFFSCNSGLTQSPRLAGRAEGQEHFVSFLFLSFAFFPCQFLAAFWPLLFPGAFCIC
jgi:hypothetical protein